MPTAAILTTYFFPNGDKNKELVYSGADRYLVELIRLFREHSWSVLVVQIGDERWETTFEGAAVHGIPGTAFDFMTNPLLNKIFNEMSLSADIRIYFAPFTCFPEVIEPCITVCHGIYWDCPQHPLANGPENIKKEFFRRLHCGLTSSTAVVSVDTAAIQFVRSYWSGDEKRMYYIPNFVDTRKFYPAERKDWDRPRVLYPRRLTTLRGSNEFLWAVKELKDVDFIMAGHGDEEIDEERIQEICSCYDNLRWVKKSFDEMPGVYREADVAVVPSRSSEGTSLSALEAMASGLPVVATYVGGLPNIVIDGFNGVLYNHHTERLHDVLANLLSDRERLCTCGRNGRLLAETAFDISIWKNKWWTLVSEVLK